MNEHTHPALQTDRVAVVTGAASGIGHAACAAFAGLGMRVCMVDLDAGRLETARDAIAGAAAPEHVMSMPADVAEAGAMEAVKQAVYERFGGCHLLMNNAVTRTGGGIDAPEEDWRQAMEVNFWGVLAGVKAFLGPMQAQGSPGIIVNTGSKQGITNPPGNAAYNVTKAALKTYTEALEHELRNREGNQLTAHLLVPGWTTTGDRKHQPGAWLPHQVVERLLAGLARGDFYIVCPDDEVTEEMDRARILWAATDITENRPPLSRWHPDWKGRTP